MIEGTVQPTRREFLLGARLTLYVGGDWTAAFRAPRYAVVLGRSQDLASYRSVDLVALRQAPHGYYEDTLLPWRLRTSVLRARTEMMARWIDYESGRQPHFDRFLVLKGRARTDSPQHWMSLAGSPEEHWIDPDSPPVDGLNRAVWMHPLTQSES